MVRILCEDITLLSVYLVLLWHNFDCRRRHSRSIMNGRPPVNLVPTVVQDIGWSAICRNTRISSSCSFDYWPYIQSILGCIDQFLGSLLDDNNALNNETTTPRISINIYEAVVWVLGGVGHRIWPPGCRTSTISHSSMDDDDMSWVLVPQRSM